METYAATNGYHQTETLSALDILVDARQARYAAEAKVKAMKDVVKVAEALALLQERGVANESTTVGDILLMLANKVLD